MFGSAFAPKEGCRSVIFCLLATPEEAQVWQSLAKKREAESVFFVTTTATAFVQACGGDPPEVLVVDDNSMILRFAERRWRGSFPTLR